MAFAWEVPECEASSSWLRFVLLMQERHAAGESREAAVSPDVFKRHVWRLHSVPWTAFATLLIDKSRCKNVNFVRSSNFFICILLSMRRPRLVWMLWSKNFPVLKPKCEVSRQLRHVWGRFDCDFWFLILQGPRKHLGRRSVSKVPKVPRFQCSQSRDLQF